ncbi:hypothetical protein CTheo_9122 [Ceratobasidium theobromae]|uniref:Uncharacterized protein n=1 Tax=Ceratobasidium theobromae TaxID=1582974 RepID=A0A5N5Q6N3_9AGAM|nr:hypothetical protein CTheo_9122 [Ceratobasidium theobromae]
MTRQRHDDTTTHRLDAPIRHPGAPTQRRIDATMRRADYTSMHRRVSVAPMHRSYDVPARRTNTHDDTTTTPTRHTDAAMWCCKPPPTTCPISSARAPPLPPTIRRHDIAATA